MFTDVEDSSPEDMGNWIADEVTEVKREGKGTQERVAKGQPKP